MIWQSSSMTRTGTYTNAFHRSARRISHPNKGRYVHQIFAVTSLGRLADGSVVAHPSRRIGRKARSHRFAGRRGPVGAAATGWRLRSAAGDGAAGEPRHSVSD